MTRSPLAALSLLLVVGSSCNHSDSNSNTQMRSNLGMDLASVRGFVIAQAPAAGGAVDLTEAADAGSAQTQLYALNPDGSLTVVTVTEGADGSSSSDVSPVAMFDTKAYLLIAYHGVSHGADQCNWVAAGKKDGALYCVTASNASVADFALRDIEYGTLVQSDSTGTRIWINHDSGISLLDLTDPSRMLQSTPCGNDSQGPNGPPDGPFNMAVNASGSALVGDINGNPSYMRVMFPGGGFFNVNSSWVTCPISGTDANPDDFYYTTDGPATLVKLTAASATSFEKTVLRSDLGFLACGAGAAKAGSHIFMTGLAQATPANQFVDIENDIVTVRSVAPLATLRQVSACAASLFILGADESGNGGIVRYDTAGSVFTTLLAPGDYSLTTMSISPGCEVTFYGQRAADGAFILGNVPAGGSAVTVVATGFPTVTQIARIN